MKLIKTRKVRFCKKRNDNIYMNNFYYPQRGDKALCCSCGHTKYKGKGFIARLLAWLN